MYTHVRRSITHNSRKVEATQVPINGYMDKQNVFTYNGILFSLLKEGILTHATTQANLTNSMVSEISQIRQDKIMYDSPYMTYQE